MKCAQMYNAWYWEGECTQLYNQLGRGVVPGSGTFTTLQLLGPKKNEMYNEWCRVEECTKL